jgi:hypothetical protein
MERGNEESEKWRIEIAPASGVCDSVGVAAIEERSARLGVDGKISSMCADVVRIKVGTSSHISESPDEQDGNNENPDPATPASPDAHYSFLTATPCGVFPPSAATAISREGLRPLRRSARSFSRHLVPVQQR